MLSATRLLARPLVTHSRRLASTSANVFDVSSDKFEASVLKSDVPVLVDFYATWCGPCKVLTPVLSRVVEGYGGKVKLGKVDIDNNMELASEFDVSAVPTVVGIKNGKVVDQFTGAQQEAVIKKFIDKLLAQK